MAQKAPLSMVVLRMSMVDLVMVPVGVSPIPYGIRRASGKSVNRYKAASI